ncbi:MAG: sigma-70 family RNA polymerase sigma factor [Patescibacteria group bacterium]|nr:sigma-70 family RNA polymerase sigma factor [Patescibacteria group bacterium]MDD5121665.1 sigma-70 family RNA polymerase sigma factor [Patescibacteria group bacterium]MDD5222280.1 sigma-70 family RNA polymerase sigma factor [Patescibacteria group bacterium]MDD5396171.1 sigma-70 family RNA polymerase sigma factor [Patescibacteria group bacterium]
MIGQDINLVRQYLNGDEQSLEILIKKYLKQIYGFVYRYTNSASETEDITQEVFLRMWRNIKKFDQKKNFKTWLFAIAKNAAIDHFRKYRLATGERKAVPFSNFENEDGSNLIFDTLADLGPTAHEIFERKNLVQIISLAVEKLSEKYQTVLSLYYHKQLNFREIAEQLNQSINTVKSNHRRAIIALKNILLK